MTDSPDDSRADSTPVQVTGTVRIAAALIIALIALGITALAVRWVPAAAATLPG